MHQILIDYLRTLHAIGGEEEQLIVSAFTPQQFKEGEILFEPGHVCRQLFFICSGVLRIVRHNEKGNEVTHFFLREHAFCSILNSFNNGVIAAEGIQASCDADVLTISKTDLTELYNKIPYLKELLEHTMQQMLIHKIDIRTAYLGYDSTERYALFLERQPDIALRVPLSDVASYLGITPQSLSRIRRAVK